MKKDQIIKKGKLAAIVMTALSLLAGCGGGNTSSAQPVASGQASGASAQTQEADAPAGETAEVTTILIGTGGSPKPWLWVEEDGTIAGYDAEVIYAVDELLPQYEFVFEKTEFASLFTGVDAGRYVMAVNNFAWREERAEKYLYGDEYVCYEKKVIIVKKGNTDIKSLADIGGHSTYTSGTGLASQLFLEDYNVKNPENPVELVFSDADTLKTIQDIVAGVVDFGFLDQPMLSVYLESYPSLYEDLDIIELTDEETESINPPYTYFIFARTEQGEEVKAAVDGALKELKDNGTISELSLEYIGYDVTGR
ncbi:MAG: transporter substrate-binding domain-containing protein [Lachnospiraceae bacterium]|nr:transporter substrate-binding domain-containing protein [Lachnospiraceae bacterium]MBO7531765.1 transporter substrate-binding domain-containing protein [Lachnospiraceae bacterium]MBP5471418.1 transporter substrate-binding domain-containing protein [Lachnospiraceae bacterium]MBP5701935.1 transporter substrate-binding domain-containing protein [Lachnospiraceae bacterium]